MMDFEHTCRDHRMGSIVVSVGRNVCLLAVVAVFCLGPLGWQVVASVKLDEELVRVPPLFPTQLTAVHYERVLLRSSLVQALINSTLVATGATAITLVLGSCCAFTLARLPIPGRSMILGTVLMASMFPPIAIISPLYLTMREMGLRDSLIALGLVHAVHALPLTIWLLTAAFQQVPRELYHAARVDGCTPLKALLTVVLLPARPGLAVAGLLTFIHSWNEFMFALTLTASDAVRTAPVAVALFPGLHDVPWGDLAAASIIVTLPVAGLAAFFNRHLIGGLTAGSVKG